MSQFSRVYRFGYTETDGYRAATVLFRSDGSPKPALSKHRTKLPNSCGSNTNANSSKTDELKSDNSNSKREKRRPEKPWRNVMYLSHVEVASPFRNR